MLAPSSRLRLQPMLRIDKQTQTSLGWIFCFGSEDGAVSIPVGRCRAVKSKEPAHFHPTEADAEECYRQFMLESLSTLARQFGPAELCSLTDQHWLLARLSSGGRLTFLRFARRLSRLFRVPGLTQSGFHCGSRWVPLCGHHNTRSTHEELLRSRPVSWWLSTDEERES